MHDQLITKICIHSEHAWISVVDWLHGLVSANAYREAAANRQPSRYHQYLEWFDCTDRDKAWQKMFNICIASARCPCCYKLQICLNSGMGICPSTHNHAWVLQKVRHHGKPRTFLTEEEAADAAWAMYHQLQGLIAPPAPSTSMHAYWHVVATNYCSQSCLIQFNDMHGQDCMLGCILLNAAHLHESVWIYPLM